MRSGGSDTECRNAASRHRRGVVTGLVMPGWEGEEARMQGMRSLIEG